MASIRRREHPDGTVYFQVRQRGAPTRSFEAPEGQQREALRLAKEHAAELERMKALGTAYVAPPESFGAELDAYLARKGATTWKASTARTNAEVARLLNPLRLTALPQLRRPEVEDLLVAIARRAPRRAQQATAMTKAVLCAARGRGQVIDERILEVDRPRYEEREHRFLSYAELLALASWMPERIRRIVPFAGLTGMRQGEILALEEADLHLAEGCLFNARGKTPAARRKVQLSPSVAALLREQLLARGTCRGGSVVLFPTKIGTRWDRHRFYARVFQPARDAYAAGLEDGKRAAEIAELTFHDLRHTAVSLMAVAGWRPEHIAEQIGHADGGALILRRYRHLFRDEMAEQAAKLELLIAEQA